MAKMGGRLLQRKKMRWGCWGNLRAFKTATCFETVEDEAGEEINPEEDLYMFNATH